MAQNFGIFGTFLTSIFNRTVEDVLATRGWGELVQTWHIYREPCMLNKTQPERLEITSLISKPSLRSCPS